jgi:Fe-S cluster assembly scaffold protein SufB
MTYRKWNSDEDRFLKSHYSTRTNAELADDLDRSPGSVKDRAARLGISNANKKKRWSNADIEYLRKNYNKMRPAAMAKKLNRSYDAVRMRAHLIFRSEKTDLNYDDLPEATYHNPFLTGKIGGKPRVE